MTWYDPNAAYTVSAARLYVDGLDDCFGQTDSVANPDLGALIQSTLTAQTELTAYMSESFVPPLLLEIDYTEKDGGTETGTVYARLNLNNGLNLFYADGHIWALENGCDELLCAMNVDTDALREAQARVQAAGSTSVPIVTPVPTATSALPTAAPSPTVTPEPTAAPDDSETDAEALPEGAPFAPDDIHDLIEAQLYIGSYVYFATDETNALREMEKLLSGAEDGLVRHGVEGSDIDAYWVPGAFELPLRPAALPHARRRRDRLYRAGLRQLRQLPFGRYRLRLQRRRRLCALGCHGHHPRRGA